MDNDVCYAARRVKQKVSLNPRGGLWANDNDKFGQKMLEKMGWEKGKGLGSNLQGTTDPVKAAFKADARGMGYNGPVDQLAAHQSEFDALLSSLNTDNNREHRKPTESLEKKSKSSKSRVHYHKSTRAKDVSNYSANDISSILGVKKPAKTNTSQPLLPPSNNNIINAGSSTDYFNAKMLKLNKQKPHDNITDDTAELSNITINAGSSTDYFKAKMLQLKNRTQPSHNALADSEDTEDNCKETKKRKKEKKKKRHQVEYIDDPQDDTENLLNDRTTSSSSDASEDFLNKCREKQKKKRKNEKRERKTSAQDIIDHNETNSGAAMNSFFTDKMRSIYHKDNPTDTSSQTTINAEADHVHKKKKKRKKEVSAEQKETDNHVDNETITSSADASKEFLNQCREKQKKKRKGEKRERKTSAQAIIEKNETGCEDSMHNFFSAKMQTLYNN